ncbi:hypothetical protein EJ04DRAFT_16593 [Polyplosphaeria fusca]|uniref:Uncharacterized protein n=1 Tax=Polyplosphaeria fusca TaxID=682080 RepID=A0A9P4UZI4_9PLEO|nr:hypothetical protein EJ04DRAFT_16593 [Polyplosphaeria fusca]
MSQFPQAPAPGAYVPPDQNTQSSQAGYNAPQPSPYGAPQHHGMKAGFGQMLDQAVTTGKPMLNKLGKTISSKLGGKQSAPGTPQHLESYQNYQQHHQQQNQQQNQYQSAQQPPQQPFSPQPQQQQQQWQQPQNAYNSPQQSPYPQSNPQSNYATPASGHSGQSNYFQQNPAPPTSQIPQQQSNVQSYNPNQFGQGQNVGVEQAQPPQQYNQGQLDQSQSQGQVQTPQGQFQPVQFGGQQQSGVVPSPAQNASIPPPLGSNIPPYAPQPPSQQQQAYIPPTPGSDHANLASQNASPAPQQAQPYAPSPPPQPYGQAPILPTYPTQGQQQQQQQQQQWAPMSPASPQGPFPGQMTPSMSPPPQTPVTQGAPFAPTEFIAELPADLGNLKFGDTAKPERPPSNPPQGAGYQAYQPPGQGPSGQRFSIPRRAISTSSLPVADPWRIADPVTELPTREFYMLADLLFDALDQRYEPQGTGLLEATKILESSKAQEDWKPRDPDTGEEVAQLFMLDNYSAFARMWSLQGIPHMMVPVARALAPLMTFQPQTHSHEMAIAKEATPATATYPTYIPALNRAGWYKSLFLEVLCEPESLHMMMTKFCADSYRPGALNQPDFQKQDKAEVPGLAARAKAARHAAVPRVCQEMAVEMQRQTAQTAQSQGGQHTHPSGLNPDSVLKL